MLRGRPVYTTPTFSTVHRNHRIVFTMGPVTDKTRMIMPDYLKYNFIKQLMPDAVYQRVRSKVNTTFSPDLFY